ncbi:Type II toxin-antitoxin system RelE/ParE family toxin [Gillisia limnaea]
MCVSKQTTFYYRVLDQSEEIEIITIFDTRQSPDRLNKDIR